MKTKTILAMMFVAFMSNAYAAEERVAAMSAEDAQAAAAELAAPVELVPVQAEPSSADTVVAKPQEAKPGKPVTVSGVLSALGQTARIAAFVATYALPFGSVAATAMQATDVVASTAAKALHPKR